MGVVFHGDSESAIERSGEGRGGSVLAILHFDIFGGLGPLEPDFLEPEPAEPAPGTEPAEPEPASPVTEPNRTEPNRNFPVIQLIPNSAHF